MGMNPIKIKSRKALKFLGLLISAMVIATVSAAVYNYMYIQGTAGILTGTGLQWVKGTDAPTGATIEGNTVKDLNMTTNEGNPRNYTDCLRIKNNDDTTHDFQLKVTKIVNSTTGALGNFTEFNLVVFNNSSVQVAVLNLKVLGSTTATLTIGNLQSWRILFEIIPISTPTADPKVCFEVELRYVVTP